jgi:uncharacterized protein (DUF302 family)
MLDYDIGYAAYMPCRIAMIEDESGERGLMMMNLDMLIALGDLPPDLHKQAVDIRDKLMETLEAGANGEL